MGLKWRYRWIILTLAWLAYLQSFFHRMAYPALLSIIKEELNLSFTMAGTLMSAFLITYTALQFPGGYIADRFKYQVFVPASLIILGTASMCFGSIINYVQGTLCRMLMGIGSALIYVPGIRLIMSWFSRKERGVAIGIYSTALGAGSLLAMVVMPILAISFGWRFSFAVMALPTFTVAALCWLLVRSSPEESGLLSVVDSNDEGEPDAPMMSLRTILLSADVWLISISMFFYAGALYGVFTFVPNYLFEVLRIPLVYANLVSGLSMGLLTMGIVAFGWLSDRMGQRKAFFVGGQIAAAILILSLATVGGPFPLLMIALIGWFMGAEILGYVIASEFFHSKAAGTVTGFVSTVTHIGGAVIPVLMGYIIDLSASYITAFMFLSTILIIGAVIAALIKEQI